MDKGFDLYDKLYGDKSDKEKKAIRMRLLAIAAALLAVILLVTVVRRITAGSSDGTTAKEAGNGTVLTGDESIEELTQMAENGNAEAQRELGFILANPEDGTEPDYEEAFRWSMAAAEQGNEYACYDVGLAYQLGNGVEKNYEEAEKWYIKAADAGLTFAYHVIGYLYLYPEEPNEPDSATAASWFARGAEEGDQTSAYELGLLYEEGNGVEQDYEKAAEFYLQAAEGEYGYKYAQYHLGVLYEYGLGVTEDRDEALYWYKAAADQGHTTAQEEYDRLMQTDNP